MTAKFTPAPDLELMLRRDPAVQNGLHGVADMVQTAAVRRAGPHADTGHYIDELKIEDRDEFGFAVIAGASYSDYLEWGTCSRRLPEAPTPCPHPEPKKTGVHPQLIMTGAVLDVTL